MQTSTFPERGISQLTERKAKEIAIDQEVKKAVLAGLGHFVPRSLEFLINLMEQEFSLDFERIADNPKQLRIGLSKMFGEAGQIVEMRICRVLAERFRIESTYQSLEDLMSILKSTGPAR